MPLTLLADASPLDWNQLLVQLPVVAVVLLAAWWATKNSDRRNDEHRKSFEAQTQRILDSDLRVANQTPVTLQQLREHYDAMLRELRDAGERARQAQDEQHRAELIRLQEMQDEHVKSKNAEIKRLTALLAQQRRPEGET